MDRRYSKSRNIISETKVKERLGTRVALGFGAGEDLLIGVLGALFLQKLLSIQDHNFLIGRIHVLVRRIKLRSLYRWIR